MFLEWIAQLQFFTPSPSTFGTNTKLHGPTESHGRSFSQPRLSNNFESNLSPRYNIEYSNIIRRTIAAQVVGHLLQDPTSLELLTSVQHVVVVMETIGQAFGLDVEDNSVIMQCAELYRRWLLSDAKPAALPLDEQFFYVEMFKHISMLFTPRDNGSPEAHAKMCAVLLETFEASAKEIGHRFTQDTWESLLKVLMGISDHLLRLPELMTPLANLLCPLLIKSLCIIWIRSKTQNNWMWDKLKELIFNWRHRMPIVVYWNALCATLTRYVVDSLYGSAEQTARLSITCFGVTDEFEMDQSLAKYFWYRFLHILGDLETLDNTGVYLEAFKGIKYLARMFFVGLDVSNPAANRPDGNEILHVFGPFLFDAINIMRIGFDHGKAEAFDLILQIAHDKHETDFDKAYLSYLYRGILQGLGSGSGLLVDTILSNGAALLQSNLRGIRVLVPSFWTAVGTLLTQNFSHLEGSRTPINEIRASCYRIINYLISMPHLFKNMTFGSYFDSVFLNGINGSTPFSELLNLRTLLLDSMVGENDDGNRVTLMSMMLTHILESPSTIGDFPMQFVRAIASLIVSSWSAPVVSMGILAFQQLAQPFHLFDQSNDALPGLMVNSLCDYLDILMHDKENRSGMNEELMVRCFSCITSWVMLPPPNAQWLFKEQGTQLKDKTLLFKVLTSVFLGITGRHNATAGVAIPDGASPVIFNPTEHIIFAARFLLHNLINTSDQYPSQLGPSVVSAQRIEIDEASISGFPGTKHLQTYVVGSQLVSVVRNPRREDGSFAVTAITRDASGRRVWHAANFFGSGIDPWHTAPYRSVDDRNVLAVAPPDPIDPQFLEELFLFLGPDERDRHYRLLDKVNQRRETEKIALSARHYGWDDDVTVYPPRLPETADQLDATVARVFLSNLGFHTMQSRSRVFGVRDTPEAPFDYNTAFSDIDNTAERLQLTVGVVYVSDGSKSQKQIFGASEAGSVEYQKFLAGLGSHVDLNLHRGFSGYLDPQVTGASAIYHGYWDYELIYHVNTMIPSRPEASLGAKQGLLCSNSVLILWIDHVGDFIERGPFNVLKDSQAQVLILISPITTTLSRINIFTRSNLPFRIGPLVDDAIVSNHALPTLVRMTAVSDRTQLHGLYLHHQMAFRQAKIDEFIRNNRNDAPSYVYLTKALS